MVNVESSPYFKLGYYKGTIRTALYLLEHGQLSQAVEHLKACQQLMEEKEKIEREEENGNIE